jgi:hypothetical protein
VAGQGAAGDLAAPAGDGLRVADEGTSAAGTWLELAIEADPEAVEAVSEILSRVAAGGVSVEQPFATEQEGLAAVPIEGAPATLRAYLPAIDRLAAEAAIGETRTRLGHLTALGLRPIAVEAELAALDGELLEQFALPVGETRGDLDVDEHVEVAARAWAPRAAWVIESRTSR